MKAQQFTKQDIRSNIFRDVVECMASGYQPKEIITEFRLSPGWFEEMVQAIKEDLGVDKRVKYNKLCEYVRKSFEQNPDHYYVSPLDYDEELWEPLSRLRA